LAQEKQKTIVTPLYIKLKNRLQFSGWLQYIIHATVVLIMLVVAGIGWLVGYWPALLFWTPLAIAALLSISLVGTIVMVKYGIHPTERIPNPKTGLDAFDLMRERHSCRSFQKRNLTGEHLSEILESVRINIQQNQLLGQHPIRFEYIAAPLTVWPVVGAHEFLVAIAPREYNRLSIIDVGRSLQKIVLHATGLGLATCWIGPGADQKSIVEHLGEKFDSEADHVICVCAIGYESMYEPLVIPFMRKFQHKRLPLTSLFFSGHLLTSPLHTEEKPYSEYGRCFEVCQWSPSAFNGQTTRCAANVEQVSGQGKLTRFDFYAATSSRYYAAVALGIWCANWETGCSAMNMAGYFAALSPEELGFETTSELPIYDVSWIIE